MFGSSEQRRELGAPLQRILYQKSANPDKKRCFMLHTQEQKFPIRAPRGQRTLPKQGPCRVVGVRLALLGSSDSARAPMAAANPKPKTRSPESKTQNPKPKFLTDASRIFLNQRFRVILFGARLTMARGFNPQVRGPRSSRAPAPSPR